MEDPVQSGGAIDDPADAMTNISRFAARFLDRMQIEKSLGLQPVDGIVEIQHDIIMRLQQFFGKRDFSGIGIFR